MTQLFPYALPGVVVVSLVGALVMCLLALRYAVPPDTDEDAEYFNHRLLVLRFGHAVAAFCFAMAAVLAVVAFKARPDIVASASVVTAPSSDDVARVRTEVQGLEGTLRQQLRHLENRLTAVESVDRDSTSERGRPAVSAPLTAPSPAAPPAPPAPAAPSSTRSSAPSSSTPSSIAPAPSSARLSSPSALPAPTPAPVASRPTPGSVGPSVAPSVSEPRETQLPPRRPAEVPQPWALPRSVRVEVASDPPRPTAGQSASYTVRLIDVAGRPVVGATVSLFGRLTDGTAMQTPLEPGTEPGTYHGRLDFTTLGPTDLRVRVVRREGRFEMPVSGS
jgi:hypothetical protein